MLCAIEENHSSANRFTSDISSYVQDEIKHGVMLGPFDSKPIALHISSFMTKEKPESNLRGTTVDLN